MKRYFLLAFLLFVSVFSSAQSVTFTNHYAAPSFTADYPTGSEVKYSNQKVENATFGTLTVHSYAAGLNNDFHGFFVSYTDSSGKMNDSTAGLDRIIDGAIANLNSKDVQITQRVNSTIDTAPGRSAVASGTIDGTPFSVYMRVAIVSGTRMWQVFVLTTGGKKITADEAKVFLDSVKLER